MSKMIRWGQPGKTNVVRAGEWAVPQYFGDGLNRIPKGTAIVELPLLTDRYSTSKYGEDATLDRASGTSVIDFEGIVRPTLVHEFGLEGARRVENRHQVDFTLWSDQVGITLTAMGSGVYRLQGTGDWRLRESLSYTVPSISIESIWIISNNGLDQDFNLSSADIVSQMTVSNAWQRFGLSSAATASPNACGIVRSDALEDIDVLIKLPQNEDGTDQAVQAPSEFVEPNDSACSQNLIPVRYYATENGNTVDVNGVVTEAIGAAITGIKGFQVWEGSTNLFDWSNDITQWFQTNITEHDFESFTPIAANGRVSRNPNTSDGASYTISFELKSAGNTALDIRHANSATGSTTPFAATTEWAKYSLTVLGRAGGGIVEFGLQDVNASGFGVISVKNFQVEEKPYTTPLIHTSGAAATRLPDNAQTTWPTGLVNDFVVGCNISVDDETRTADRYILDGALDVNNSTSAKIVGTVKRIDANKDIAGVGNNTQAENASLPEGLSVKYRNSATQGVHVWTGDVIGAVSSANTDNNGALNILHIGQRANLSAPLNGNITNAAVWKGDLTDAEVIDL